MKKLITIKQKLSQSRVVNKIMRHLPGKILLINPIKHLMIEPTNICNLRCLFCTQSISKRQKGMMSLDHFRKIAEILPLSIREVQLHFAGESVLNKDLPEMIKILKSRGIKTILSSNGTLPFEDYENIINAGLDQLIISFDGATKEIYEQYRKGGNFEIVLDNLDKIAKLSERKTELIIQFIVMKNNESQIEEMKKLAKSLGVDTLWLKSASLNIGSSEVLEKKIIDNAKKFLPQNQKYSRYILKEDKLIYKDRPLSCPWIFRTVILWNGDVVVCCTDLEGEVIVGNVLKEGSFDKIWRSEKYDKIRKLILSRKLKICKNCNIGDNPIKETIRFNKGESI
mgnify:CR=1 FL=1